MQQQICSVHAMDGLMNQFYSVTLPRLFREGWTVFKIIEHSKDFHTVIIQKEKATT